MAKTMLYPKGDTRDYSSMKTLATVIKKSLKANIEGSTQISISDNVRVIYQ
jgi:hypothetical protein